MLFPVVSSPQRRFHGLVRHPRVKLHHRHIENGNDATQTGLNTTNELQTKHVRLTRVSAAKWFVVGFFLFVFLSYAHIISGTRTKTSQWQAGGSRLRFPVLQALDSFTQTDEDGWLAPLRVFHVDHVL